MSCLGLDIGGANLKAATSDGWHASLSFPLWREPEELAAAIRKLIVQAPATDRIAATMTGELADCFRTKREGVRCIVAALVEAAASRGLSIYLTDGRLVSPEIAIETPWLAAASNWHALASFVARAFEVQCGALIDLGSTTCDLIPLVEHKAAARGRTDTERLLTGELIYTGVIRSPLCAVTPSLPYRGAECPIAQELFATTIDSYLLLGQIAEDADDRGTADGRPATREFAHERLARTICADTEQFEREEALIAAGAVKKRQLGILEAAFKQVLANLPGPPRTVVTSGQGEFLARDMIANLSDNPNPPKVISLSERLGAGLSRVGPAYALARLAEHAR